MHLTPNSALLHYRIVEKIGEGGMGEVWKARDTTLDRDVAIKLIPQAFAGDPERLARFVHEAKMLAALNHPNIAAVYGLHEAETDQGEIRFIAMELVPGEDLSQRLDRGPLAVEDAIDVARQVADALEAAHEQGVIHRDLKPANIKRTPDGKIKVLDLGLAKALGPEESVDSPSISLSPTVTSAGTVAGTLLGTAAYMSPEQSKGRPVDRRADIWAFGVVLYEMLTARKLFRAETVSETLAAVLRDEVSLDDLPAGVPPAVVTLMRRCLDREPRTRLRDIGEARIALAGGGSVADVVPVEPETVAPARVTRAAPWVVTALLALVAAYGFIQRPEAPTQPHDLLTLVAPIPDGLRLPVDQMGAVALSPDGKTLALTLDGSAEKLLHVRRLDRPELVPMPGTENAATPFFSPDGQWIGFFADDKLKKVPVGGGAPVTICESVGNNRGATWTSDDFIIFSPHYTRPLMRVSGAGGEATVLTTIDNENGERTHRWPNAVPGHDLVLFTVGSMDSPESYDEARIQALRPSTGEQKTVLERASMAMYVPTGHLVFGREGFLFAVPFDLSTLETRGKPVPVMENVMGMRSSGVVHVGIARNGLLAYVAGAPRSRQSRLVWVHDDGSREPLPAPVSGYENPRISPDRTQIAVGIEGTTTFDIWTYHLELETLTRLTFEGDNTFPCWSPDGRRIAFSSVRDNALESTYLKAADGSGQAEELFSPAALENTGRVAPWDWTPDGETLIVEFTNEKASNLGALSVDKAELEVLLDTPATEGAPAISPNGRWLAYMSDEAGEFQIFVRAFPGPGGKWQVSTDGGAVPRWSPDGKTLFFRWQKKLFVASVEQRETSLRIGQPKIFCSDLELGYDVFDSERILLVENVGEDSAPAGVTVVVNWLDELKRRVPN